MPSASGEFELEKDRICDALVEILEDLIRDYDTDFSGGISSETRLVGDLMLDSLTIVMLIVAIEGHFKQQGLPFEKVLMSEGHYVDDLRVGDLVEFLSEHLAR